MLEKEISTEGSIHIHCSKQLNPFDFHGQLYIVIEVKSGTHAYSVYSGVYK